MHVKLEHQVRGSVEQRTKMSESCHKNGTVRKSVCKDIAQ